MTRTIIGIGGGSASGKSTVVERLIGRLGAETLGVLAHDRYYRDQTSLPADARATLNFDHPDALETELLLTHLAALRAGAAVEAPVYDFTRHARSARVDRVEPRPVMLVEGVLVLADARLRAAMDLRVFVDTDDETRYARRLERDVAERGRTAESVRAQFDMTVRPMHAAFVEPSRQYADIVIADGGFNDVGIDRAMIEIARLLQTRSKF
jgi:uridine kinase